ncbi:MAG TPA: hypothetical protein DC000_00115, partial [Clostridiales bacterium]|nr:hypothetical protein [Clostridiales bacterium]
AGTTISATGLITGTIAVAGAFVGNLFIGLANIIIGVMIELNNLIATVANAIATVFNDPVAGIILLFSGLFDVILGVVQTAAKLIDTVFGSNLSDSVATFRNNITTAVDDLIGDDKVEVVKKMNQEDYTIDRFEYGKAWDTGYKFGEGLEDKITGAFNFDDNGLNIDDLTSGLSDTEVDVNVKDDVNLADESLKYLLDEVTQKYINNINVQAPAPQVSVKIDVANGADLDLDELAERTKEKIGTDIVEYAMSSTDIRRN